MLKNRLREEIVCAFFSVFIGANKHLSRFAVLHLHIHGLLVSALRPDESRTMIKEEAYRGRVAGLRKTLRYRRWLHFSSGLLRVTVHMLYIIALESYSSHGMPYLFDRKNFEIR